MWETWVRSPSQEDPLEKEMATHSSALLPEKCCRWRAARLQYMGSQRVAHDRPTSLLTFIAQLVKNLPAIQETLV